MLPTPRALLLDFGGVIVDAPTLPSAPLDLIDRIVDLVDGAVAPEQVARDLVRGTKAYAAWRDRDTDSGGSGHLDYVRIWDGYVAAEWPTPARAAIRAHAQALSYAWALRSEWRVRHGIPELLELAAAHDLPVGIVSNTVCGAAHRDYLVDVGLDHRFATQVYSDEAEVRKPQPDLALIAAERLRVPIGYCWFVGDSLNRDIPCARRAGAAAAVLMRSARTDRETPPDGVVPDVVVEDPHQLCALLRERLARGTP